ncbi:MAG: hypothetical protein VXV85_07700, partial [Candidatus Thermoplasmatota archaeon]|nr:hypothetical protein [Candidatus Thermoplasmatota archaeon]
QPHFSLTILFFATNAVSSELVFQKLFSKRERETEEIFNKANPHNNNNNNQQPHTSSLSHGTFRNNV